jgi:hypothetical protein
MTTHDTSYRWRIVTSGLTTAVLVPGPLGALRLFGRRTPGPLRPISTITSPEQLHIGRKRHADALLGHILCHTDLYVVPARWLASVPREDLLARATLAARLVAAHRRRPIERYYAEDDDSFF